MKIVEIFSSIDGEGIRTGQLCTFIRTFGCNCRCSYCDSMYALEGTDYTEMSVPEIVEQCIQLKNKCITLTGGEPLIHNGVYELLEELIKEGFDVNVETNGTVDISKFFMDSTTGSLFFTVDYKTPYSKEEPKMCMDNFYKNVGSCDVVKFVCGSEEDLNRMLEVVTEMEKRLYVMPHIFVSPVFGAIEAHKLVDFIKEHNLQSVRVQLQLHKYIYDPELRGV